MNMRLLSNEGNRFFDKFASVLSLFRMLCVIYSEARFQQTENKL